MYICQLLLLQLLIWASYRHYKIIWTGLFVVVYTVFDVLLIMYCMCLPACFVTSADKRQSCAIY